jgi:hypothetical protein
LVDIIVFLLCCSSPGAILQVYRANISSRMWCSTPSTLLFRKEI